MTIETSFRAAAERPSFRALFTPKLITILSEGYGFRALRADIMAGLTVAIAALPLSMAIAIASATTPERGLYTAIAGLLLMAAGFLRLGTCIKFIPYAVTVGFTAGIAVIIFASRIPDLFGLTLAGKEPGEILPKLVALAQAAGTINPVAVAIAAASIGLIVGVRRWRPHWPGMLIAAGGICDGRGMAAAFALGAEGIQMGTRFVSAAESPVHANYKQATVDAETVGLIHEVLPVADIIARTVEGFHAIRREQWMRSARGEF